MTQPTLPVLFLSDLVVLPGMVVPIPLDEAAQAAVVAARASSGGELLLPALRELAASHDLVVEPGKQVIEVRSPGMHKGIVVERLVDELHAGGFVFVGDDLGDVEAFEAVRALAKEGLATLLVCSADAEESALHPLSDVLVHGPEGVLDLLRQLTADAAALRA